MHSVLICLKVIVTIIQQTHFPISPSQPSFFFFMEILFLSFTGYKVEATKDLSPLKIHEILLIQTQKLIFPHKVTKVCAVHIILQLLGPMSLFQADSFRDGAAQISTGTLYVIHLVFCYCFYTLKCNISFSILLVTPFYCPVIHMTYCYL